MLCIYACIASNFYPLLVHCIDYICHHHSYIKRLLNPCLHGLDRFLTLMAIFHSVQFCARSQSIFRDLKTINVHNLVPNLLRSTLSLLPLINYISAFLHQAIIIAFLYMAKPPDQSASSMCARNYSDMCESMVYSPMQSFCKANDYCQSYAIQIIFICLLPWQSCS